MKILEKIIETKHLQDLITAMPKEKCVGCGECCSSLLPMTKREIKEIRRFAKKHNIKPKYHPPKCPWLNENNMCNVYEVRPIICQTYDCREHKSGEIFAKEGEILSKYRYMQIIDLGEVFCGIRSEINDRDSE